MERKKVLIIALGVLLVVALVAVLLTVTGVFGNSKSLTTTIKSSGVPTFTKVTGNLAGLRNEPQSGANEYAKLTKTNIITLRETGANPGSSTSKFCQALIQTSFLPAYQVGQGDEYLSKNFAYNQAQTTQHVLKNEGTVLVDSNQGKLEFVTGTYDTKYTTTIPSASTPSTAPSVSTNSTPNPTGGPTSVPAPTTASGLTTQVNVQAFIATRAIDSLYANGASKQVAPNVNGLYGADPYKGVPVLTVTYTCYNKTTTKAQFDKLLAGLHVQL